MTALQAAGLWSGLLILVMVGLSVRVMRGRWKHRVSLGDGGVEPMTVLSRAFGNAAEYIPVGIAAMILMAQLGISAVLVHGVGAALLLGRMLHPFGLAMKAPNWARAAGMLLTWGPLIFAAGLLVGAALA